MTDPLESISTRFREYNQGGQEDTSLILSPDASDDATELWRRTAAADGDMPMRARQALAWFHFARYHALPEGQDRNDLQAALAFFTPVFVADPSAVPDTVREFLIDYSPATFMDNDNHRGDREESFVHRTYPTAMSFAVESRSR